MNTGTLTVAYYDSGPVDGVTVVLLHGFPYDINVYYDVVQNLTTIDSNGEVLVERRKLKPFHMERTIFGDGDGFSLANVAMTSVGRVGSLSCGVSGPDDYSIDGL